jgi:tryptophanase
MATDNLFSKIHSLGLLKPLLKISNQIRQNILKSVYYNTDMITNQLAVLDMLTDSRMHRISSLLKFFSSGSIDVYAIKLDKVLKDFTGYTFALPVSQGRQAEQLLTMALSPRGKKVITNGLFISTWHHTIHAGAEIIELHARPGSEEKHFFQGNINITELESILKTGQCGQISHVYIECCNNALGGKAVSFRNFKEISQKCREYKIPLILDATRIFQNAELIRRYEPGFHDLKLSEIVLNIFKLADGCTISSTKEMNVETGGIIGLNDTRLAGALADSLLLQGDGLSIRAKAELSRAYSGVSKIDSCIKHQVDAILYSYNQLRNARLPIVAPPGGVGLYLFTDELRELKIQNPERAFLAWLYLKAGILGSVNYSTPLLSGENIKMLRFVITPEMANYHTIRYFTTHLIKAWQEKDKIRGLQKTWQPEGKAGEYFARYKMAE